MSVVLGFLRRAPAAPAAAALLFAMAAGSSAQEGDGPAPFFDARTHQVEYAGPGGEVPPPKGLREVKIGWFGPTDRNHPLGGSMWQAASLAVDEANEAAGLGLDSGKHLKFKLLAKWSENPWGSGIKGITDLVYADRVWALVGAPDSASAHLVEQVVAKARLVFLSPVATDKTTNLVNVPWIFSCAPEDTEIAPVLAEALLAAKPRDKGFVLISGTDHDSRHLAVELLAALDRRKASPRFHIQVRPAEPRLDAVLERAVHSGCSAAAVLAGPVESARIVKALRRGAFQAPVVGGPQMGRRAFLDEATRAAEAFGHVRYPRLWSPAAVGERAERFRRMFRRRFGLEPDYAAAHAYDAIRLLIAAVRKAGLNRVRIRDAAAALAPFEGVTGTITWLPTGRRKAGRIPLTGIPRAR